MRRLLLAICTLAIAAVPASAQAAAATTTVILVRHAEKAASPADDPPQNAAGEARSRDLAKAVRDALVIAIITTQFARTRATGQPIATALGITPTVVAATNTNHVQDVVAEIRKHPGQTVLVVGHSNTVPAIVEALGAKRPPAICDSQYDNLYVVTMPSSGAVGAVRAKYGDPSPRDSTCAAMR
jgi:broad specificity phosphatase PhoE